MVMEIIPIPIPMNKTILGEIMWETYLGNGTNLWVHIYHETNASRGIFSFRVHDSCLNFNLRIFFVYFRLNDK